MGWAQEPQTLNPFVDQDEEDFRIWALNYDLLVDFGTKDLGPVPGIAENWEISPDKKTVTFKLFEGHKWSDGQPITSKDVKYSLQTFAPNSLLFPSYVDNVTSIDTPDDLTVVIKTKQPDARIVGGLFAYILPEHIWGKQPVKKLTPPTSRRCRSSAAGPTSSRVRPRPDHPHDAQPELPRREGDVRRAPVDQVRQHRRRRPRAPLGEIDFIPEVAEASFARLEKAKTSRRSTRPRRRSRSSRSTSAARRTARTRSSTRRSRTSRAPGDRLRDRPQAHRPDRLARRRVQGHGLLPEYYKAFYAQPADDYPLDVDKAKQMLDDAGGSPATRRPRQGRPAALVRPVRALRVAGEHPGRAARAPR